MKYIKKLFEIEDFNPGDFLDDLGVDTLTVARLKEALSRVNYPDSTVMKLISEGDIKSHILENGSIAIEVKNSSEYNLRQYTTSLAKEIVDVREQPYITIDWNFIILSNPIEASIPTYSVQIKIKATCKHPIGDFKKVYYSDIPANRSTDINIALILQLDKLTKFIESPTYEVYNALYGRNLVNSFIKSIK